MSTADCDEVARVMASIAAQKIRRAGLVGAYASADCDLGRRVADMAREGRGAYLWGEPGTGKTYAASCAVRLLVADEGTQSHTGVWMVTAKRLLDLIKEGYDEGDSWAQERAEGARVLAMDDLGAERRTEWSMETIEGIIDARYLKGLPTIITSNYRIGQIRDLWGGMEGKRIASRLAGSCESIEVKGRDRRING